MNDFDEVVATRQFGRQCVPTVHQDWSLLQRLRSRIEVFSFGVNMSFLLGCPKIQYYIISVSNVLWII